MAEKRDQQPKVKTGGGVFAIITLAVAAAASSFATVYLLTPSAAIAVAVCKPDDQTMAQSKPQISPDQTYVELSEVMITIGSAPATRYLKMSLSIVTEKDGVSTVKAAEPVLIDAFVNYLRSVELSDFEDPGFYARMRQQLARRSELVLGGGVSDGVLITEFLLR